MKVLLVEDHPAMRFAVRTLLQLQEDMDVVGEADNVDEALRLSRRLRPTLVILDLNLRGEPGGIEACREMKDLPDPPRVLIYTAYNSKEELHSCFLCGADGYVHKREEPAKLVEAVREIHAGKKVWHMGDEVEEAASYLQTAANKVPLTPREKEVMPLVVQGYTNDQIARELSITLPTVKTHVSHILKKLNLKSRRELS